MEGSRPRMEVQEPWLTFIRNADVSRRKTVEGRVGSYAKHQPLIGQIIEVYNETQHFLVRVKFIRHYSTLIEYITGEGWMNIAPQTNSFEECLSAYRNVMMKSEDKWVEVFSDARIATNGGMNALHLEVVL
jgi:ASC-1-like (ASCH) protein